jgi:hypothetical protein
MAANIAMLVDTDPGFTFALWAFNDLSREHLIANLQNNRVTNAFICNLQGANTWGRDHDYAKSVGVVMRAFFVCALNLDRDARVAFPASDSVRRNKGNGLVRQASQLNFPLITNVNDIGRQLFERFDQMFPHFVTERELRQPRVAGGNAMVRKLHYNFTSSLGGWL